MASKPVFLKKLVRPFRAIIPCVSVTFDEIKITDVW
jgi:hypothetical protein